MKRAPILFFFLLFFLPSIVQASPPTNELVKQQAEQVGVESIKQYWDHIVQQYGGLLPESQKGSFWQFINGEKELSLSEWLQAFIKFLLYELMANGKLLSMLILLTIFSLFLQSLQNAFSYHAVSKVAHAVVYMVLMIIALNSFHVAVTYAKEAIQTMTSFMIALLPILLALMASSGGVVSVAFFHPIVLFFMNITGTVVERFSLPLLFLATILSIVSLLSEHYKVTKLANLLRNISVGSLGIMLTIFFGVLSVKGATTAIADGIAIRAAKFVAGNFIPIIGRMFTDAADTVVTASVLLKNTVGLFGVALLLLIAAFPAIKILVIALIYQLAAAILQPMGGGIVISCLSIMGKSIMYVLVALMIVSLMFFLSMTVIIAAGNLTMMVR